MNYAIRNAELQVVVEDKGAQMTSVQFEGKERLYQGKVWPKHAPVLFPFAGYCKMRVDEKDYQTSRHGFARDEVFSLDYQKDDELSLSIESNEKTLALYPFSFHFSIIYKVENDNLIIIYSVKNTDNKPLYFSTGGHDSFALVREVKDYELVFEREENFLAHLQNDSGRLNGMTRGFKKGRILDLNNPLLKDNLTLILADINSREVLLREKYTKERVCTLSFPSFSNLALWHPDDEKMICIEPWLNLPDVKGENLEFKDKLGIKEVLPNEEKTVTRSIRYF